MNADDLQELYKLMRGSRSALMVLEVRTLFLERQFTKAHALLLQARESYAESRSRLLKQDPKKDVDPKAKDADRQIKRLTRKQEKVTEILEKIDELAPQLDKLARRQQTAEEKAEVSTDEPDVPAELSSEPPPTNEGAEGSDGDLVDDYVPASPSALPEEFAESFNEARGEQRLDVIGKHFGFREVNSEADIHPDALYFIHSGDKSFLIHTFADAKSSDELSLASAIDEKAMKPMKRSAFIKLGNKRKMVLLTAKSIPNDKPEIDDEDDVDHRDSAGDDNPGEQHVLDKGSFSQLLTSAQRSGLVPGADQIAYVRDREFRMGNYELAFQSINAMFSAFTSGSNQRAQRLVREDADIASGRVRISPKDLLAKRARDRAQTQEIERARRRFQVVLEGLRVLMNTK